MEPTLRPRVTAGIALVGAGMIAVTPVAPPPPEIQVRAIQLTSGGDVGLIVGGSNTPIPQLKDDYVTNADALYIQRILPGATSQGVFTPEGLYPIYTGVKSLPLDTSVAQGRYMLDNYITNDVNAGDTVAVYGLSQSSTISGFVMNDLEQQGIPADSVKFALAGDPSNPDGGLLERFDGLTLPSLGATFSGATPPDTIYDTSIYTQEYDGFPDFPKYPINFLSDLNAFLGVVYVHPTYLDLTPEQLTPVADGGTAIVLPTTPGYDGATTYYMIPMAPGETLPLLRPLESIPIIGKPLADLLQPDLTQIVNLGYDNPDNLGWDAGPANVPTQFGLFPSLGQVMTAINNLGPGTEQGVTAAINDISAELSNPSSLFTGLVSGGGGSATALLPSLTDIVNALTAATSSAYSILLPTADIATALAVSMPAYDVSLFVDNIANPLDAVGLPLAADTGLVTLAAGFELMVIVQTVQSIMGDLSGLITF